MPTTLHTQGQGAPEPWTTLSLLRALIAFPTISADPNRELIGFCAGLLEDAGARVTVIPDGTGKKANLFATIGPPDRPGVVLSGHTDVVPVAGQAWTVPPFEMTEREGKLFGRGTTDMKGFVACALMAALKAARLDLRTPLHLALSHDEEVGCVGVRSLIDMLAVEPAQPLLCLVGEPTLLRVANGHKGKIAARVKATGHAAHSSGAPAALNAIHMACDMIGALRDLQADLVDNGPSDAAYDVPFSTVHVGTISGGSALNIVPDHAEFQFEVRTIAADDPAEILERFKQRRDAYVAEARQRFKQADVSIDIIIDYPSLETDASSDVVTLAKSLSGTNHTIKVAYGTEGGLFSTRLGLPTVVCGPGSIEQAHKPDEFIERAQLAACDRMLDGLLERLVVGLDAQSRDA